MKFAKMLDAALSRKSIAVTASEGLQHWNHANGTNQKSEMVSQSLTLLIWGALRHGLLCDKSYTEVSKFFLSYGGDTKWFSTNKKQKYQWLAKYIRVTFQKAKFTLYDLIRGAGLFMAYLNLFLACWRPIVKSSPPFLTAKTL